MKNFLPPPPFQILENQENSFSRISAPLHFSVVITHFEDPVDGFQLAKFPFRLKSKI